MDHYPGIDVVERGLTPAGCAPRPTHVLFRVPRWIEVYEAITPLLLKHGPQLGKGFELGHQWARPMEKLLTGLMIGKRLWI